jgi:hypothetical protein
MTHKQIISIFMMAAVVSIILVPTYSIAQATEQQNVKVFAT